MGQEKLNISQIAKLAGVSKTTVSRVINHRPDVNAETREKIEAIIQEYEYCPSAIAQAVSHQRSMMIGLVFPDGETEAFSNPYYAELMQGVLKKAREKGYRIVLSYLRDDDCFTLARQKIVDGLLILTPGSNHREKLEDLLQMGVPVVSTARVPGMTGLHYVAVDEYSASCKIIEHLISLGHRQIAYIGGPKTLYSGGSRLRGYQTTLKKHQIPYDPLLVELGDTSMQSGYQAMERLMRKHRKFTAVFACSDLMAIGAKHAIEKHGLRVPQDISLVSTDSTAISDYLDAPLTTMKQPTHERGEQAMRMLIDLIEGKTVQDGIMLPMGIVIKETTQVVAHPDTEAT